jgi:hypothetical protein
MISGPLAFARYGLPPSERGLCGPHDHAALRGYALADVTGPGLVRLTREFAGAWPYLEFIAAANRIADPLDARVVEAYWIGNRLLDNVSPPAYGAFLEARFRGQAGRGWDDIARAVSAGGVPHHSFHVFIVYPWTGLLRQGRTEPSLRVLDDCRISWGQVAGLPAGDSVVVRRPPLTWDGRALSYGPPEAHAAAPGVITQLRPGDWVSLHWGCVCDRLTLAQLSVLRRFTDRHLRLANAAGVPDASDRARGDFGP